MDGNRFDDLSRRLATRVSRRAVVTGTATGLLGLLGVRRSAASQVSQAQCGNVSCKNNPGKCNPGCVCCGSGNGNTRCRPAGACDPGMVSCPGGQVFCPDAGRCAACCGVADCPAPADPCLMAVCQGGVCGFASAADGGACDDGNACTQTDTCQGGVCVGTNPLACSTDNPCLEASCDPALGCVTSPKPAETPCDDATRCDGREKCDGAGTCVEGTAVTCPEPGQCQQAGVCDPVTGNCSYQNKADGATCTGTDRCFRTFACLAGDCIGQDPVCGPPSEPCRQPGICNPSDGSCTYAPAVDGTPCDDGVPCTNSSCQAGACVGTPIARCCTQDSDCPKVTSERNSCDVPYCDEGRCRTRFVPAGLPCAYPREFPEDRCVTEAECFNAGAGQTVCFATETSNAPACADPCETAATCDGSIITGIANSCEKYICVHDDVIGRGGCQVAPDPAKNGNPCTEQCFDCGSPLPCNNDPGGCQNGVFNNQRCIPDGSCQDGTCQPGPGTYECDPSPFLFCCFEQGICSSQC